MSATAITGSPTAALGATTISSGGLISTAGTTALGTTTTNALTTTGNFSASGNVTSTNGNLALYAGKSIAFSSNTTAQYWYCTAAACNGQGNWTMSGNWLMQGTFQPEAGIVSVQTGAYTLAATDCGTLIRDKGATAAHTYTVPTGLPIGCQVEIVQEVAGDAITISAGTGETIEALSGATVTNGVGAHAVIKVLDSTTVDVHP